MNDMMSNMLRILKAALWGLEPTTITVNDFNEMSVHRILGLTAPIAANIEISLSISNKLKLYLLQHMAFYVKYIYAQSNLPIAVPYVILKGTSAAQYYPHPEHRVLGDIDIMTRREDFDTAYQQLVDDGYHLIKVLDREVGFVKNGIVVELHRYFASLNDPEQAKYLDDLIIDNITPSHVLPDLVNGLVILEHISQHLENGIGLRQIIDWMMFVDKCLPDEKWHEFCIMAEKTGMVKLAIVATRVCEIYLGLPVRKWSAGADEKLCEQFMQFVLSCGDFGRIRNNTIDIPENVFMRANTVRSTFNLLQERGLVNWSAVRRYSLLRPFAWIYQLFRYFVLGIRRGESMSKLKEEYRAAKRRNDMFDQLGIKQASKGLVVYRDGKYVKK